MIRNTILGILTSLALSIPAIAFADANGSVGDHYWHRDVPTDNIANAASLTQGRSIERVGRGQTAYWAVVNTTGTQEQVIQGGALADCTIADASDSCASAPLWIASSGAHICVDSEMGDNAASGAVVNAYVCSSSTCTRTTSITTSSPILSAVSAGNCSEIGNVDGYAASPLSGVWVYVDVSTGPTTNGDTVLVWITGH